MGWAGAVNGWGAISRPATSQDGVIEVHARFVNMISRRKGNDAGGGVALGCRNQPRDGRIFLITNLDPRQLKRRYTIWAWVHLTVLLGSIAGSAYFLG